LVDGGVELPVPGGFEVGKEVDEDEISPVPLIEYVGTYPDAEEGEGPDNEDVSFFAENPG
jgi:hypothetical protein